MFSSVLLRRGGSRALNAVGRTRLASTLQSAGQVPAGSTPTRFPPANTKYINFKLSRPLAASLAFVILGVSAGIVFPPEVAFAYHPPEPSHSTPHVKAEVSQKQLEAELASLPVVTRLRHEAFEKRESDAWRETRSFQTLEARHSHNLIAAVLMGRERLAIPPLVRERKDGSASVVVLHVGNDLCGHPGMVHGGLVATLFDQYLARLGLISLGGGVIATANLNIDYRAPVRANQFLVLRLERETTPEDLARKPHKVAVRGRIEDTDGKLLAEARGIFVQPRDSSKFLKTNS